MAAGSRTAVIKGDVVRSRKASPGQWLPVLKGVLAQYGSEPRQWEIKDGDAFTLELEADRAIVAMLNVMAAIMSVKGLSVRMALGVGEKTYDAARVNESNGTAFAHAGDCFDQLGKAKLTMKSDSPDMDEEMNIHLSFISHSMGNWTPKVARIVQTQITHPNLRQVEIAKLLPNTSQPEVSKNLGKAGYDSMMAVESRYRKLLIRNT